MALEEDITSEVPDQLIRIAAYWESTRTCINIKVLPDQLEKAGSAGGTTRTPTRG